MSERTMALRPGLTMALVDEVLEQLGDDVSEEMLRWWWRSGRVRRAKVDGHWWYHLEACIEVDYEVRASGRGRPRGGADPGE